MKLNYIIYFSHSMRSLLTFINSVRNWKFLIFKLYAFLQKKDEKKNKYTIIKFKILFRYIFIIMINYFTFFNLFGNRHSYKFGII